MTPISAKGMVKIIIKGWMIDSNCEAMTMYTKKIASASASLRLLSDVSISLFCPART